MIDWRGLLNEMRVQWRDRGANTSQGNVNICCPWCTDDQGFHLAIAEHRDGFYCFREPNRHSGAALPRLLIRLGARRDEAVHLLNKHRIKQAVAVSAPTEHGLPINQIEKRWGTFSCADQSPRAMRYLLGRGFENPEFVARRFDLRVALEGSWANRLLLPYRDDDRILAWTGRALKPEMEMRYLTQQSVAEGLVYAPRMPFRDDKVVLVEGPVDALKIVAACEGLPISAIALTGKALMADRLVRLRRLTTRASKVFVVFDADVHAVSAYQAISALAQALDVRYIQRLALMGSAKDPAELSYQEIRAWLKGAS